MFQCFFDRFQNIETILFLPVKFCYVFNSNFTIFPILITIRKTLQSLKYQSNFDHSDPPCLLSKDRICKTIASFAFVETRFCKTIELIAFVDTKIQRDLQL